MSNTDSAAFLQDGYASMCAVRTAYCVIRVSKRGESVDAIVIKLVIDPHSSSPHLQIFSMQLQYINNLKCIYNYSSLQNCLILP